MGFMDKVKQVFGIGGVKLQLQVAPTYAKNELKIDGNVLLSSKSAQRVEKLEVKLVESWTVGRGESKETKEFDLGMAEIPAGFDIAAGEQKTLNFVLPFKLLRSSNQDLAEKGGALGMLGKAAMFADGEKSEYRVIISADVKGTTFGPSDSKRVQLN